MKQKRIAVVLVDVKKELFGTVTILDELDTFHQLLNCRYIDIVTRRIGMNPKPFEIICDDEFLLNSQPKISAISSMGAVQMFGNILITGPADPAGELTSLSGYDADYILSKIKLLQTPDIKRPYPILTECEYL